MAENAPAPPPAPAMEPAPPREKKEPEPVDRPEKDKKDSDAPAKKDPSEPASLASPEPKPAEPAEPTTVDPPKPVPPLEPEDHEHGKLHRTFTTPAGETVTVVESKHTEHVEPTAIALPEAPVPAESVKKADVFEKAAKAPEPLQTVGIVPIETEKAAVVEPKREARAEPPPISEPAKAEAIEVKKDVAVLPIVSPATNVAVVDEAKANAVMIPVVPIEAEKMTIKGEKEDIITVPVDTTKPATVQGKLETSTTTKLGTAPQEKSALIVEKAATIHNIPAISVPKIDLRKSATMGALPKIPPQIPPVQPISLFPEYIAKTETVLIRRPHWLRQHSHTILDEAGNHIFEVNGSLWTLSARKHVTESASGKLLYDLRRDRLRIRRAWYIEVGGERRCTVRGHHVRFTNASDPKRPITLVAEGSKIHLGNTDIGPIVIDMDGGKVRVAEGLDLALAAALETIGKTRL